MSHRLTVALLVVCVGAVSGAFAAEWPKFLGPTANSHAPDEGINKDWSTKPPSVLWQVSLGDNGFAGPSVAAGKVFITDHVETQDIVRALKLDTGEELWRFAYADAEKESHGFARATPTYDEGNLYTCSRLGRVYCLDAETGKEIWSKHLADDFGGKAPGWGYAASAVVDGEKLILVPGGEQNVVALNKKTGETIWTGGNEDAIAYSTPAIATILGQKQYVIVTGVSAIGVHVDTGEVLWRHPWENRTKINVAMPCVGGPYVLLATGYGHGSTVIEITEDGPVERWYEQKHIQAHFSSPVYHEGSIYGVGDPGYLFCLNPMDGSVRWQQKGFEKGGIVIVDGAIIAIDGQKGDVVLVNLSPDGYEELGRMNPLGGQSWTAPIVSDGRLIVRNKEAMTCLDIK